MEKRNIFQDFVHNIKSFFWQIKRIFMWLPVIWKDRDWDFYFFYDILKFKITNILEYFKKDTVVCTEEQDTIVADLERALELLDILQDEKYRDEAYKPFYDKYPNYKISLVDCFEEKIENGRKMTYYNNHFTEEMSNDFDACHLQSISLHNQYRNDLFTLISDRINYWWD